MPEIICLNCSSNLSLDITTYWTYQGDVKCRHCGTIMGIHTIGGQLQSSPILKGPKLIKINDLPLNIEYDVVEAQICQLIQAYKSCVVMCRRALEQICDDKGANGGNLKDKIKSLYDNRLISPDLFDAFNEIRYFGNYGAHPKDDLLSGVDQSNAQSVLEVTIHVAQHVYEMPAKVRKLKQIRTKA